MTENGFIQTNHLSRIYRSGQNQLTALSEVTFSVARGRFVGITGASGSGKSTLMNLLGGLDTPTSGQIYMADREVTGLDNDQLAQFRRRTVGMIFQSFNLVSAYTARENVMLPMIFADVPPVERRQRADTLLDQVGLSERAGHRPTELSGGEQQRVAIARALANHPTVLLADEPTGNLDSRTSQQIMALLTRLNTEQGLTLLMISHEEMLLRTYAHDILVLEDGQMVSAETKRTTL